MKLVKIPKKTPGEFREIAIPTNKEKLEMRLHLPLLNDRSKKLCDPDIVHGFLPKKSPVTNARKHIGYGFSLRFDLSNFFDTVKPAHVAKSIPKKLIGILMPDDRAYQGLPTSPLIANIAGVAMDAAIKKLLTNHVEENELANEQIVYTRYADDLTFSFNQYESYTFLKKEIPKIIKRSNFKINEKKTWLQDSRFGDRMITGILVSKTGIRVPRKIRKKMRAALHKGNTESFKGLSEWSALRIPRSEKNVGLNSNRPDQEKFNNLLKLWKLRTVNVKNLPTKRKDELIETGDNTVLITGDPVQVLGLSNWTTNWSSCMRHPTGCYHIGAVFWLFSEKTTIAGLLSGETATVAGFERPKFSARALIHEGPDGTRYHDRIYGESYDAINELSSILKNNNIKNIDYIASHISFGYIPKKWAGTPYLDNLEYEDVVRDSEHTKSGKAIYYHLHN